MSLGLTRHQLAELIAVTYQQQHKIRTKDQSDFDRPAVRDRPGAREAICRLARMLADEVAP